MSEVRLAITASLDALRAYRRERMLAEGAEEREALTRTEVARYLETPEGMERLLVDVDLFADTEFCEALAWLCRAYYADPAKVPAAAAAVVTVIEIEARALAEHAR